MKFVLIIILLVVMGLFARADDIMTKTEDGTYIINSTTLCDARGFRDITPVEIYIHKGTVQKVIPLKNQESPDYFNKVNKYLLPGYEGISVKNALEKALIPQVDGCTGASYSTKAVQKNIRAALDYYQKHK